MRIKINTISFIIALLLTVQLSEGQSQRYHPNWESLDQRPVPEWFEDAKFGIFIHWGPYSVPAWSPKGTYSEWYQYWLQSSKLFGNGDFEGDEVTRYHHKTYGEDFSYYQFGEMFKADLFDPEAWASLFEKAGAKYIVLTSKHHDGFTLWPNAQANDRGFAWNSMEVGPKRDLVGDLSAEVKKTKVKMGLYYSLYEWYHPWWQNDTTRFVNEHFLPQIRDLIQRYEPDILWGDGEWDMEFEKWKTPELIAWLYNESTIKDKVVINDRWGKGIRKKHGGYFTTEYESEIEGYNKPWEECRGIGFSFGYNQNEDAGDYNSTQVLILMLIDIVSNGGNLLLDIGPDARGNIPPIMQQRLLEIGEWLTINGEAIYGTRKWTRSAQWSAGDRSLDTKKQHYASGDRILLQTVNPKPGKAVKEVFFTIKGNDVFAITPKFPKNQLVIQDFDLKPGLTVTLMGYDKTLNHQFIDGNLVIDVPPLTIDEIPCRHAWSFKISNGI